MRPEDAIFKHRAGLDNGVRADDVEAAEGSGGVNLRQGVNGGLAER